MFKPLKRTDDSNDDEPEYHDWSVEIDDDGNVNVQSDDGEADDWGLRDDYDD